MYDRLTSYTAGVLRCHHDVGPALCGCGRDRWRQLRSDHGGGGRSLQGLHGAPWRPPQLGRRVDRCGCGNCSCVDRLRSDTKALHPCCHGKLPFCDGALSHGVCNISEAGRGALSCFDFVKAPVQGSAAGPFDMCKHLLDLGRRLLVLLPRFPQCAFDGLQVSPTAMGSCTARLAACPKAACRCWQNPRQDMAWTTQRTLTARCVVSVV